MKEKIIFKCFIPELIKNEPIKKIKYSNFNWVHKLLEDFKQSNKKNIHTARCPGINSIMNTGWIQCAYQDIEITTFGDYKKFRAVYSIDQGRLKYGDVMGNYIGEHHDYQLNKFMPFKHDSLHTMIKIQSPWRVYVPEGYSLLTIPIPYPDDTQFTAAIGILKGKQFLNIPLYWHRINSTEVIKKGTPLCQYILIKNDNVDSEMDIFNEEDMQYIVKV